MSTFTNTRKNRTGIRWQLLSTVSAAVLIASVYAAGKAEAADADRPTLWIELGGQFDQFSGQGAPFAPPFVVNSDWKGNGLISPAVQQKMNIFSLGEEASISFEPSGTDWVFTGSLHYGRSGGHKFVHQQLAIQTAKNRIGANYSTVHGTPRYAQTKADSDETHMIADFQAGKDVGLGLFGSEGTSVLSAGVRFAQFSSRSSAKLQARPDTHFVTRVFGTFAKLYLSQHHEYFGSGQRADNFHGVGPSISWNASAAFAGNPGNGEITLDWGANAAVLFGRQKARTHHHSTGLYLYRSGFSPVTYYFQPRTAASNRSRSVVVPNLGGFAGLSFRFANSKVSIGYRGDFFFGAMDTGFDARKSTTRGFYGPFASVSVGVGD